MCCELIRAFPNSVEIIQESTMRREPGEIVLRIQWLSKEDYLRKINTPWRAHNKGNEQNK